MPTYIYTGFDEQNRQTGGSRICSSEEQMFSYLEKNNISNYSVYPSKTPWKNKNYGLVSPKELSIFCKQISVLFYSHMTLMEGVHLLSGQTENSHLKQTLVEVYEHMERGLTFATAMGMYPHIFGTYLLNMIYIGEVSGTLDSVFARMSDYYDKEYKTRKKIRSAVAYPVILTALMAAIVILLVVKILPMFDNLLTNMGGEMPGITQGILRFSSFVSSNFLWILLIVFVIIMAIFFYGRSEKGKIWKDQMKTRIPLVRFVYTRTLSARFSRSMAILLKSGVQILNAMQDTVPLIQNQYLLKKFNEAIEKMNTGESVQSALTTVDIFPPLFLKMMSIGEDTGHIDEMLDKCASVFDDEVDDAVDRLTVLLEPALIIVLSVIVAIILISVMLPMIEIMNQIG